MIKIRVSVNDTEEVNDLISTLKKDYEVLNVSREYDRTFYKDFYISAERK